MTAITKPLPGATIDYGHPINRGQKGWWLFNEGAGSRVADISGNGNHGTITNADLSSDWTGSLGGGALSFDGIDAFVDIGDRPSLDITERITLSAWVYSAAFAANVGIISDWSGSGQERWNLRKKPTTGLMEFIIRVGNTNLTAEAVLQSYSDNTWHHFAGSFDGVNMRLLVDGGVENIVGDATAGPIDGDTSLVQFGTYAQALYSAVLISNVRIYNRALNLAEKQELFNSPYVGILD